MEKKKYSCEICGKKITANPGMNSPVCCGEDMLLDESSFCRKTPDAEMDRSRDEDDACEDFTGKQFDKRTLK